LARALVSEPKLLLADEPTGNLDARTGEETMQLIGRLHRESQLTTILVTHNAAFARRCDRVLQLANGRLEPISVSQPM
jgi:lipoprotein-releasing system ATP-binding protein